MERLSTINKKTGLTVLTVLVLGFAGGSYAQSSSMSIGATGGASTDGDNADKKRDGGYSM